MVEADIIAMFTRDLDRLMERKVFVPYGPTVGKQDSLSKASWLLVLLLATAQPATAGLSHAGYARMGTGCKRVI